MFRHTRHIVIVKSGSRNLFIGEIKAQWFDQVQTAASVRREPDQVTRVGRNFGLVEHDVEHWLE